MEFTFSEDQRLIRDTAANFLSTHATTEHARAAADSELGYQEALWRRISDELAWPGIAIPEAYGGLGLGVIELAIAQEQAGRQLLCSPFFATVCLAANALLLGASALQREQWLPRIAAGEITAALGFGTGLHFERQGASGVLNGSLRGVVDGHSADLLVLLVGGALLTIEGDHPSLIRNRLPTMDQTRAQAQIEFSAAQISADACSTCPAEIQARIRDVATVTLAAEQAGGAGKCLDEAVAYALERRQFRRQIASFQAIKHKCADMMLRAESARSAAYYAACVVDECFAGRPLAAELPQAAAVAGSYCGEAFFHCAAENIQIHGGVGFAWEYDAHLYFKRAGASLRLFSLPSSRLEVLAVLLLDADGADEER